MALCAVFNDGLWNADYGSLVMFQRHFSSIEIFLQTENDTIKISPLVGAVYNSQLTEFGRAIRVSY